MKLSSTSMLVPALLAVPTTTRAQAGPWVERIVSTSADGATSVLAADLDGDGDGALDVLSASHGAPFSIPIPPECRSVGDALCTQGGSVTATGEIRLANALDIRFGTF